MMEEQYGMADLRQYTSGRPLFPPPIPATTGFLATHRGFSPTHALEMFVVPRGLHQEFCSDSTNSAGVGMAHNTSSAVAATTLNGFSVFEMEPAGGQISVGGSGTVRWPRQETLTLLDIRSRLDSKFKEANQKGPLWDEVSRIMHEEHGYQRSGKKCREKFENLYKYYKKTKEGKAGRHDGKHYRFYRQLEALYGETTNLSSTSETHFNGGSFQYSCQNQNTFVADNQVSYPGLNLSDTTLSLSNSSDPDTSLSDDTDTNLGNNNDYQSNHKDDKLDERKMKKRKGRRNWKAKIRDFIDSQMKKLMDKQEALMEKMMRNIEHKEQERMIREEEWRKQDVERIEREHKFWATERAWMEARDNTLMDALQNLTAKELRAASLKEEFTAHEIRSLSENQNDDGSETMTNSSKRDVWPESEIWRLIQLRTGIEAKFHEQSGISEEVLWDEISHKMACFGYERSGLTCKEKWDSVNNFVLQCNKKRKEDSRGCSYDHQNNTSMCSRGGRCSDTSEQGINYHAPRINNPNNASPYYNGNGVDTVSDGCFRYFIGDALGRIMD